MRTALHDLIIPTQRAASEAATAVAKLSGVLARAKSSSSPRVIVETEETPRETAIVPREAFKLFIEILAQMANGNAVTILPVQAELTTQQAAELLNVSRPFVVKLIEQGKLPHRIVGTHRRILVSDLMAYKEKDDAERRKAAAELTAEAQKLGLDF